MSGCCKVVIALTLLFHASTRVVAEDTKRPNVVIIVADDLGWNDVGFHNKEVKTPFLDKLVGGSVRLDRFYSYPICSMSRAALLTGMSTSRTGVNNSSGLDLAYHLLPQTFKAAGYQTWMFGKWHLGGPADYQRSGEKYLPHHRGFDYFYGHLHGAVDYTTHRRKDLDVLDWQRNGKDVVEGGFSTDLLADDAVGKLKGRDKNKPVFLYLAFNAVHGPLQAPPSNREVSKREKRKLLLANVAHMDTAIGRVLKAVTDEGMEKDTLVLFFSDNGGQLSQGARNVPLRGEKGTVFEGGIRVPASIRLPGVLKPGSVSRQVISVIDLFPTLATAAGVKPGNTRAFDGSDLWANLRNDKVDPPENLVIAHGRNVSVLHGPWKLVQGPDSKAKKLDRATPPMLFRIEDDPEEKKDLAAKYPNVVKDLLARSKKMTDLSPRRRK